MPMYIIKNDWDDRTFCGLDAAWVNDGRESAHFATESLANDALDLMTSDDQKRCKIIKI